MSPSCRVAGELLIYHHNKFFTRFKMVWNDTL